MKPNIKNISFVPYASSFDLDLKIFRTINKKITLKFLSRENSFLEVLLLNNLIRSIDSLRQGFPVDESAE